VDQLLEQIARHGPVSFSVFMDAALYGPHGFYTQGGGAGQRRDFVTSPETGALFGAVIAGALDCWWRELGEPDPFVVVEAGPGPGALVAAVLLAQPECSSALRWLLVERSPAMRELQHARKLPLVDSSQVMGVVAANRVDDELVTERGQGPLVAQLSEMPVGPQIHIVLANELLDNISFDVAAYSNEQWNEVRVGFADGELVEVLIRADEKLQADCSYLVPNPKPNVRIPIQRNARWWLSEALHAIEFGRVVAIDYAVMTTTELADRGDTQWMRMYSHHQRVANALAEPGQCDITTDVALDQLASLSPPTKVSTQADFLQAHGINAIVDAALAQLSGAAPNSLAAAKLSSFVSERQLLLDPKGLGGFLVMEWKR
jgi:SAM-dependent MidA family methyltransferase